MALCRDAVRSKRATPIPQLGAGAEKCGVKTTVPQLPSIYYGSTKVALSLSARQAKVRTYSALKSVNIIELCNAHVEVVMRSRKSNSVAVVVKEKSGRIDCKNKLRRYTVALLV